MLNLRKLILFVALLLGATTTTQALPVERATALQNVQDFLQQKGLSFHKEQILRRAQSQSVAPYYIFNADKQGFAIVSGDDSMPAIIGYATEGRLTEENMAPQLRDFLKGYAQRIALYQQTDITSSRRAPKTAGDAIAPPSDMANWGQDKPYSLNCPYVWVYKDKDCTQGHTLSVGDVTIVDNGKTFVPAATGCLATALSVLGYQYYKRDNRTYSFLDTYPAAVDSVYFQKISSDITGYTKYSFDAVPKGTTFDWANLKPSYKADAPAEMDSVKAIAKLMSAMGAVIDMKYGHPQLGGSEAIFQRIPVATKKYLGFTGARIYEQGIYSLSDWVKIAYDELKTTGAVYMGGTSNAGGHAFVLCGYDKEDFFYVNWGWDGSSNGYYRLSVMEPVDEKGQSTGMGQFRTSQILFSGLYKDSPVTEPYAILKMLGTSEEKLQPVAENEYKLNASFYINNMIFPETIEADYGFRLVDANGTELADLRNLMGNEATISLNYGYFFRNSVVCPINYKESWGKTMKLEMLYKPKGSTEWKVLQGQNGIVLTMNDDKSLTIQLPAVFRLEYTNTGVEGSLKNDGEKDVTFTSTLKVKKGSVHEDICGIAIPYEADGTIDKKNPQMIYSNLAVMTYAEEGESFPLTFSFDPDQLPAGKYKIMVYGKTFNYIEENLFDITVVEGSTGIKEVRQSAANGQDTETYDLQGRPVSKGYKGLVISNGQKVVR